MVLLMKVTAQEILQDLRRVHQLLGRVPNRIEYENNGAFPGITITQVFGSYHLMIKLSGLEYSKGKRDKQQLRKKAFEHLKKEVEESRQLLTPPRIVHRALCVGDLHFPYTHPDAVQWLIALNQKYRFDSVYSVGDELDFHSLSFHDSDPDLLSAGHELDAAIKMMEPLYKEFPAVTLAHSNHGSMAFRKAKHHGMPARLILPYHKAIEAPETWTWEEKIRFQTPNGQMHMIVHSLGANVLAVAKSRGMNVIQGHHHEQFGVQFFHNEEKNQPMYGAFTGCLIDDLSYAYAYNRTNKFLPIMGSLAIIDSVPLPLPMFLDAKCRWNGQLP
jgi:hypothetical protein